MVEINKVKLLERIRSGYTSFKALLSEFDEAQMTQPGAAGEWSVKDTLAHILVHEQRMLHWMKIRLRGELPAAFQPYAMPDQELNELNEQIHSENLHRSLEEIMRALEQAHTESLHLVETTAEEDLFNAHRFKLLGGEPLWEAIAANTYQHYEEHGSDIHLWQSTEKKMTTPSMNTKGQVSNV